MTDHLPECFWVDTPLKPKKVRGLCICARLLDCEARVREDEQTRIYSNEEIEAVIRLAASKAYDAALRDAVNEVMHLIPPTYRQEPHSYDMNTADFIAAIEALGGER